MLSHKEQAMVWYVTLTSDEDVTAVWSKFEIWLHACPENEQAFREIEALHRRPEWLASDVSPAIREGRETSKPDVPRTPPRGESQRSPVKGGVLPYVASIVWFAFVLVGNSKPDAAVVKRVAWSRVATGPHEEARLLHLTDQSTIQLSADSVLDWRMTHERRELSLERGRAVFTVSRDARPFEVKAGSTQVVALGTVFSVARVNEEIVTTVDKGTVVVIPLPSRECTVGAGQSVWVKGNQVRADSCNSPSDSWLKLRGNNFTFLRYPLNDAVAAFNQRNKNPRLVLIDPKVRAKRVDGQFPANDSREFAAALERLGLAKVVSENTSDAAIIRLRAQEDAPAIGADHE